MSECIENGKHKDAFGYTRTYRKGKKRMAHRVAYCDHHGIDVDDIDGVVIRHKCDNPSCVNPLHLEIGTQQDNVDDKMRRGRHVAHAGEKHGCAKLSLTQVSVIRRLYVRYSREYGTSALARKYGVSQAQIWDIVQGNSWKDGANG